MVVLIEVIIFSPGEKEKVKYGYGIGFTKRITLFGLTNYIKELVCAKYFARSKWCSSYVVNTFQVVKGEYE